MTMTEEKADRRPVPVRALHPFCDQHYPNPNEVIDADEAVVHASMHLDGEALRRWLEEWELL